VGEVRVTKSVLRRIATRTGLLLAATLTVAGCTSLTLAPVEPTPRTQSGAVRAAVLTPAPNAPGNPEAGRGYFATKGCTGCHTLAGFTGASGVEGPTLTNISLRPTIAGESIQNTPDNLTRWIQDPPSLKPGTRMPALGLTQQEARDLAAFLYSQPYNPSR
jgi:cytochrome c1